jgi:hypothetical protein
VIPTRTCSPSPKSGGVSLRDDVRRDLSDSAYDFMRLVWPHPEMQRMLGGGRLEPVESTTSRRRIDHDLDTLAGIDAWHMLDTRGAMRSIASRVQWCLCNLCRPDKARSRKHENWRTFTIRKSRPKGTPTEYEKRLYALDHRQQGWLLPALTIQAYVTKKRVGYLLGAAIVHTSALFEYARDHPRPLRYAGNGGEGFMPYAWDELLKAGISVGEIEGDQLITSLADWPEGTAIQEGLF